ncbi:MAG TPA: hypothetical protein VFF11_12420, partial [Candidatus Binatia bacterium]|nr:hypothetical protein [Candidatus Binatia bacterium]
MSFNHLETLKGITLPSVGPSLDVVNGGFPASETSPEEVAILSAKGAALLGGVRHAALDMDGTIYSGGTLFASTVPFLALLRQLGISHTFLTNNSS